MVLLTSGKAAYPLTNQLYEGFKMAVAIQNLDFLLQANHFALINLTTIPIATNFPNLHHIFLPF